MKAASRPVNEAEDLAVPRPHPPQNPISNRTAGRLAGPQIQLAPARPQINKASQRGATGLSKRLAPAKITANRAFWGILDGALAVAGGKALIGFGGVAGPALARPSIIKGAVSAKLT